MEVLIAATQREQAALKAEGGGEALPTASYLAISGGGSDGAYTAGLLKGWTEAGTHPQFKAVTGISTGALIAPFAFFGLAYDGVLEKAYTETATEEILRQRGLLAAITEDVLADTKPLRAFVRRLVDEELLEKIAEGHLHGRVLVVGTANLDTRRAVLWNIGLIAASNYPHALDLVHQLLVASTSISAAFPPAMIDVECNGQAFQELHVDGGAMMQNFLYPPSFRVGEFSRQQQIDRQRRVFVIRNSRLEPDWAETPRRTMAIAGRAISSLIHTQDIGDSYRIYANAQRDGIDFNLAYIPSVFNTRSEEAFDPKYMRALFDIGYELAVHGDPWDKLPPYLAEEATRSQRQPANTVRCRSSNSCPRIEEIRIHVRTPSGGVASLG